MSEIRFADFIKTDLSICKITNVGNYSYILKEFTSQRTLNALVYCISGKNRYTIGGQEFDLGPGQVLLIPTGLPYSGKRLNDDVTETYLIDFMMPEGQNAQMLPLPFVITPSDPALVQEKFRELYRTRKSASMGFRLKEKSLFFDLLYLLFRDYISTLNDSPLVEKINDCVRANLASPQFNVKTLAEMLSVSCVHLRRLCNTLLGTTPHRYIAAQRLERAKEILVSRPDLVLEEVAAETGFANVYYFCNFFKKETGMTPVRYKKKNQKSNG